MLISLWWLPAFSKFPHNDFKRPISQGHYKSGLCSKEFIFSPSTAFNMDKSKYGICSTSPTKYHLPSPGSSLLSSVQDLRTGG